MHIVSLEVKDVAKGFSLVKLKDTYSAEKLKDETTGYYGFDVMFDHPVCLEQGKTYEIESLINGPPSWCVIKGKNSNQVEGIQFSFYSNSSTSRNGTEVSRGQFPSFIVSRMSFSMFNS